MSELETSTKFEDGSYQCLPGPALIAKVLAGRCKMNYTRAAVGQGLIPEGVSPKTLTEPPEYVMDAKIAAVTNPVDGECQVTVQIKSDDVATGFYAMGILLYAEDPDFGEVPYTYLKLEDGLEWIRPASSAVGKLATFDLIAAVGAVDAVSANIDPDAIATYAAVKQLISDATAVMEITIPKDGWTDGTGHIGEGDEEGEEPDMEDNYGLRVDIPLDGVTEAMQPFLSVHPAHLETAKGCELSTTARTMDGALRLYAKSAPTADMTATLTLLCVTSGAISGWASGGAGYSLPAATATRLGGVKVGDGLNVGPDGTLSVNPDKVITDEDLADEGEVAESVANILNGDGAK